MKVVVTGGAGFIGSHTVADLLRRGHEVTVVDDLSSGSEEKLPEGCSFVHGDVREASVLVRIIRGHEAVIHLAAYTSVSGSFEHREECLEINVGGTVNVLEAACRVGACRVVFASSSSVYASEPGMPKDEEEALHPESPYAQSKLEAERVLRSYEERWSVHCVALRYFNVYGPRQRGDSDYAAVIPCFVERALAGAALVVYGDGRQTRDFVYVDDVATANITALSGTGPGPYNIGTGKETSILALGRLIVQLTRSRSRHVFAPARPGDVLASTADIRRARERLGWSPSTPLLSGLRKTIEWWEQQAVKHEGPRPKLI